LLFEFTVTNISAIIIEIIVYTRICAYPKGANMAVKLGQMDSKDLFTIPNIITYFRIICVPVFVALMAIGGMRADFTLFYAAFGVFVFAAARAA